MCVCMCVCAVRVCVSVSVCLLVCEFVCVCVFFPMGTAEQEKFALFPPVQKHLGKRCFNSIVSGVNVVVVLANNWNTCIILLITI